MFRIFGRAIFLALLCLGVEAESFAQNQTISSRVLWFDGQIASQPESYVCKNSPNMVARARVAKTWLKNTYQFNLHESTNTITPIDSNTSTFPASATGGWNDITFNVSTPTANKSYFLSTRRKLKLGGWGKWDIWPLHHIKLVDNWWGHQPAFSVNAKNFNYLINGVNIQTKMAPTYNDYYTANANGPILLNATLTCNNTESNIYISLRLSNQWYQIIGTEVGGWFPVYTNNYGGIENFDLHSYGKANGLTFSSGQYYVVKVAFGPTWKETVRLIKIL